MGTLPEDHPFWGHDAAGIAQSSIVSSLLMKNTEEIISTFDQLPGGRSSWA
jgi:hypothetical protein